MKKENGTTKSDIIITIVSDNKTGLDKILILDAITLKTCARIYIPYNFSFILHGNYFPNKTNKISTSTTKTIPNKFVMLLNSISKFFKIIE